MTGAAQGATDRYAGHRRYRGGVATDQVTAYGVSAHLATADLVTAERAATEVVCGWAPGRARVRLALPRRRGLPPSHDARLGGAKAAIRRLRTGGPGCRSAGVGQRGSGPSRPLDGLCHGVVHRQELLEHTIEPVTDNTRAMPARAPAILRSPPAARRPRSAPTSTPSPVESMNSSSARSTNAGAEPPSSTSSIRRSLADARSTSPLNARTTHAPLPLERLVYKSALSRRSRRPGACAVGWARQVGGPARRGHCGHRPAPGAGPERRGRLVRARPTTRARV